MEKTRKGKYTLGTLYGINIILLLCILISNYSAIIVEKREVSGSFRAEYFLAAKDTSVIHISPMTHARSPDKIIFNISIPELEIYESFSISYSVSGWGGGYYNNVELGTTYSHYNFNNPTSQSVLYEITLDPDSSEGYKVIILHNSLQSGYEIFALTLTSIISLSIHFTVIVAYIDKKERIKLLRLFLKEVNNKKYGLYYFLLVITFLFFSLYVLLGIIFVYI